MHLHCSPALTAAPLPGRPHPRTAMGKKDSGGLSKASTWQAFTPGFEVFHGNRTLGQSVRKAHGVKPRTPWSDSMRYALRAMLPAIETELFVQKTPKNPEHFTGSLIRVIVRLFRNLA